MLGKGRGEGPICPPACLWHSYLRRCSSRLPCSLGMITTFPVAAGGTEGQAGMKGCLGGLIRVMDVLLAPLGLDGQTGQSVSGQLGTSPEFDVFLGRVTLSKGEVRVRWVPASKVRPDGQRMASTLSVSRSQIDAALAWPSPAAPWTLGAGWAGASVFAHPPKPVHV